MKNLWLGICLLVPAGLLAQENKAVKQEAEKKEQEEQKDKKTKMTPEKKAALVLASKKN